jgi:predicted lysophospholipase L1 biosynthesis ABC-type transport system permease subunit
MRSPAKYEIVGVVKDAKYRNLRLPAPRTVYVASAQQPGGFLLVRVTPDAPATFRSIEAAVQRRDKSLRLMAPLTMDELMARSLLQERMLATLAAAFGALAVLLAAVGIYGVMAFQVARRRKEIGIRVALGAKPHDVVGMLVAQTARLVLLGAAIGIPCALVLTRFTEKTLYGVAPADPATFAGAVLALAAVAIVAAWLPGRAATRIDPIQSLRCD